MTIQNQPHPVRPTPGTYKKTYIKVVNGRKTIPSNGMMNVPNARLTNGVNNQTMSNARRGKADANSAKRQAMIDTS